jgi:transcription elongation factor Elf1
MGSIISRNNCPCCGSRSIARVLVCKDYTVSKEQFDILQCDNCTVRFTQDVPDQYSIGAYYQSEDYISHSDTGKGPINRMYKAARNYTLGWKMNLVRRSAGESVKAGSLLDIGCGTGAFLHKAHLSGWSVKGIEPDEGARKICRDKYGLEPGEPLHF